MRRLKKQSGVTLTEVLIASVLVGVIFMGIVSVDFATRQLQQNTTKSSSVINQANALMLDILENAAMAVGTTSDVGIDIVGSDPNQTLCLRQDRLATPGNYTDDTWVCYERDNTATSIRRCERSSSGACSGSGAVLSTTVTGFAPRILFDSTSGSQEFVLQVSVTTRYDPAIPANSIENPEHTTSSEISPSGHSHFGTLDIS